MIALGDGNRTPPIAHHCLLLWRMPPLGTLHPAEAVFKKYCMIICEDISCELRSNSINRKRRGWPLRFVIG
jgi:hypothetical protein